MRRLPARGAGCYVPFSQAEKWQRRFPVRQTGVSQLMNIYSIIEPIQRASFALDDNTLALMALLVGIAGGWSITGWRDQLRARRARIAARVTHRQGPERKRAE